MGEEAGGEKRREGGRRKEGEEGKWRERGRNSKYIQL
jgi:hypothetical protein